MRREERRGEERRGGAYVADSTCRREISRQTEASAGKFGALLIVATCEPNGRVRHLDLNINGSGGRIPDEGKEAEEYMVASLTRAHVHTRKYKATFDKPYVYCKPV